MATIAVFLAWGCGAKAVKQDPFPAQVVRPPAPASRAVLTDDQIQIKDKIQFATGSANIQEESFTLLDEVAQVLIQNPAIEHVRIEGHTDNVGGKKANTKLSKKRAQAVRDYLVDRAGIGAERLSAKGFGPDKPIADNTTDEGRDQNRRVEFHIEKKADGGADDKDKQ